MDDKKSEWFAQTGYGRKGRMEFNLKITDISSDRARVMITLDDITLGEIRLATEYMMWIYATETHFPFEEALRDLCDGARTFKGVRKIEVLCGGKL